MILNIMFNILFIEFIMKLIEPIVVYRCVDLISRKIGTKDVLRKLLYADDLAVVVDGEVDLQEQLLEWRDSSIDMDED